MAEKVRIHAPEGASSVSHGGIEYEVQDGALELPNQNIAQAIIGSGHGYRAWDTPAPSSAPAAPVDATGKPVAVADMSRDQLIREGMRRVAIDMEDMDTEDLRTRLKSHDDAKKEEFDPKSEADSNLPEQFRNMKRGDLFAYLKARGVQALPSHSTVQLKQMAADAPAEPKA